MGTDNSKGFSDQEFWPRSSGVHKRLRICSWPCIHNIVYIEPMSHVAIRVPNFFFSVLSYRYPGVLALVGDKAEGLCGVDGIGERIACKVLSVFKEGKLECLLSNLESVDNKYRVEYVAVRRAMEILGLILFCAFSEDKCICLPYRLQERAEELQSMAHSLTLRKDIHIGNAMWLALRHRRSAEVNDIHAIFRDVGGLHVPRNELALMRKTGMISDNTASWPPREKAAGETALQYAHTNEL